MANAMKFLKAVPHARMIHDMGRAYGYTGTQAWTRRDWSRGDYDALCAARERVGAESPAVENRPPDGVITEDGELVDRLIATMVLSVEMSGETFAVDTDELPLQRESDDPEDRETYRFLFRAMYQAFLVEWFSLNAGKGEGEAKNADGGAGENA
jgi:hypothetical protein